MKPVDQTVFGQGRGDCFRACLASILEKSIEEVPNFAESPKAMMVNALLWCNGQGWVLYWSVGYPRPVETKATDRFCMASGVGSRGLSHTVVVRDGVVVHDPHPDKTGIREPYVYYWLEPLLSPEQMTKGVS